MHLMVDVETLSTRIDAHVLSVGAVIFDPADSEGFHYDRAEKLVEGGLRIIIEPEPQGRHIDPGTVMWWLSQDNHSREALFNGEPFTLKAALQKLGFYVRAYEIEEFWSHGISFDLMILQHAYDQLGIIPPWGYRTFRDTRTVFSLLKASSYDDLWPDNPAKHDPLWDAACQAAAVQEAIALLKAPRYYDATSL